MHKVMIFLALFVFQSASANDCDVFSKVEAAGLYQNNSFWEDFAKLSARGNPSETQINGLISKYKPKEITTAQAAPTQAIGNATPARANLVNNPVVELHRNAEKHFAKAPPQVQRKLDTLISMANQNGVDGLVSNLKTHGWNYEYVKQKGHYSVRLNDGYRALLEVKDGKMTIYDIGQHLYRH